MHGHHLVHTLQKFNMTNNTVPVVLEDLINNSTHSPAITKKKKNPSLALRPPALGCGNWNSYVRTFYKLILEQDYCLVRLDPGVNKNRGKRRYKFNKLNVRTKQWCLENCR